MASAEQRELMYRRVREFRKTKPLFTIDFWNDGEYVKGCVAGGREYLHINANGDIEPCAFIHYSDSNIKEKTLLEALQGPLFMACRNNQPFNQNHLRPCPLLANPEELPKMAEASGAHSTDLQHPENPRDLSAKCAKTAAKWPPPPRGSGTSGARKGEKSLQARKMSRPWGRARARSDMRF